MDKETVEGEDGGVHLPDDRTVDGHSYTSRPQEPQDSSALLFLYRPHGYACVLTGVDTVRPSRPSESSPTTFDDPRMCIETYPSVFVGYVLRTFSLHTVTSVIEDTFLVPGRCDRHGTDTI